MTTCFPCPKGHSSADSDFCSECGARIQGAPAAAPEPSLAAGVACPDCGAPRPADGVNFCEICGYNFVTRTGGQIPAPPPAPAVATGTKFILTIAVDATLRDPASPAAPEDASALSYPVEKPVSLIGRTSQARAIYPEIALDMDVAVSHRHGIVSRTPEGLLLYRDLNSSNGTRHNGKDVTPLVDTPLQVGDRLSLGHWTRITVTAE